MGGNNNNIDAIKAPQASERRGASARHSTSAHRAGMTLIEVLVAMAIIAIISVMCVSAFMTILAAETRETNTRLASESAETAIATGADPTSTTAAFLSLGAFTIGADAESYSSTAGVGSSLNNGEGGQIDTSGQRNYTLLKGTSKYQSSPSSDKVVALIGNLSYELTEKYQTLYPGISITNTYSDSPYEDYNWLMYTVPQGEGGRYKLEVWGAAGGDPKAMTYYPIIAPAGKGAYSRGVVNLKENDTIYLYVGGKGQG
ncbi:MAG: prepilin-type N-terminal cleavage/methylation domain-containing protein, partial [Clostridiales Family XIII bacterium]|nr:prepilin-type N-terminal cleavage/methylation domain-containing protein [Clostridiales Family XIII bacterium]